MWIIPFVIDKYAQSSNWESSVQEKKSKTIFETTSRSPWDFVEVLLKKADLYTANDAWTCTSTKKTWKSPRFTLFYVSFFSLLPPIHQRHWNFTFFGSPGWPWRTLCTWCTWQSPTLGCRDSPGINYQHGAGFLLFINSWGKHGRDVISMSSK